jgi:hypothetical protein
MQTERGLEMEGTWGLERVRGKVVELRVCGRQINVGQDTVERVRVVGADQG